MYLDKLSYFVRKYDCVIFICSREHYGKLLSSVSAYHIGAPCVFAQKPSYHLKQFIPAQMTVFIVIVFKIVYIKYEYGKDCFVSLCPFEFGLYHIVEIPVIEKPCKFVANG